MPIKHAIVHLIEKKPDGTPAVLHARDAELGDSQAIENLLADLNESYNAKNKAWGFFQGESGAYPFSGWLGEYLEGDRDFVGFSREAVEHLQKLMEESNLSTGGHVLFAHYQQGMTDYLAIALLHHSEGVAVNESLEVTPSRHLDLGQLHLAARINISEWRNNKQSKQYISFIKGKGGKKVSDYFRDFIGCQEGVDSPSEWRNNKQSKQYISFIKGKGGKKVSDYFRDFIGCQEGVDSPSETRTLLKAFSDFVESEDMAEEQAREKTETLVDYATSQARIGEPMTLDALSELMDDQQPRAFYDYIRNKDYGLSPEIPADKRTLNQFRRFTGRAEGLSISFEAHLLGSRIEYDEERDTLQISSLPTQLRDQLKRRKAQIGE
ncbi:nucleoid-associated protein [Pseudomonas aeruginosa]|nr:nucleoid-associated protein [Pseudomonas aeruginosa]